MTKAALFTPILIAGCVILLLNFSLRASFGVFQLPIANEFGWPRAEFSLAIAIQNLAWGIGQPIFGALAEKMGDRMAIVLGAALYALVPAVNALTTSRGILPSLANGDTVFATFDMFMLFMAAALAFAARKASLSRPKAPRTRAAKRQLAEVAA